MSEPNPGTCAARWVVTNAPCGNAVFERLGDVDLCQHHYSRTVSAAGRIWLRDRDQEEEYYYGSRNLEAAAAEVVYYVQRLSDGLIKIGTSTRIRSRLGELRQNHGDLQLLATHRGGRLEEAEAHRRFRRLWVEGEFYRPRKALMAWIIEIRQRQPSATLLRGTLPMDDLIVLARRRGRPPKSGSAGIVAGTGHDR